MTGEQYLRALRDHWKLVALALVIGILAAVLALFVVPKKYSASVDAFVLPTGATADTTAAYQGGLLSEQRVKSYVQLFSGGRVSDVVIDRLRLPETSGDLTKQISVSTQEDTVILSVSVEDGSPDRALLIANTAAGAFHDLVAQLEQPSDPRTAPATSIRIVAPAKLADKPVFPQTSLFLAAGATLGLIVGLGLALWRSARGRPVRSTDTLRHLLGVPGLGVVLRRTSGGSPLVALDHTSPEAEAFRQIRTGLQFADVDHPRKLVLITSAVEGEGKTTAACNLAAVLAAAGHRVLLVDADLRRPGAGELLQLDQEVGLSTVLMGRISVDEAIQSHSSGFDFIATGPLPPNPSELTASEAMSAAFSRVRETYEYVLVDSAPLLPVTDSATLAGLADGVVLVCRFGSTLDVEVRAAAETLDVVRSELWGTVLSMVPRRDTANRRYGGYGSYGASNTPETTAAAPPRPRREGQRRPGSATSARAGSELFDEPTRTIPARISRRPSPTSRGDHAGGAVGGPSRGPGSHRSSRS